MFTHYISNEIWDFKDKLNVDHDLVLKKKGVNNRNAAMGEYYDNRMIVKIMETIVPIYEALIKSIRTFF